MRNFHIAALLSLLFVATPYANAQVSFSFGFGHPPPVPRAYRVPPQPGPDFQWVEGYWYPVNGRWVWHDGYWSRPPMPDSAWVEPYWEGGRYYEGYWATPRGTSITTIAGTTNAVATLVVSGASTAITTTGRTEMIMIGGDTGDAIV